jgi:hypothetical protein
MTTAAALKLNNQALAASGLSPGAFADWLRIIAESVETDGQRSLSEVRS